MHAEQHNAEGNRSLITRSQRFSLSHRADLLEPCPPEDIEEMKAVTLATLAEMTGASLCPNSCLLCWSDSLRQGASDEVIIALEVIASMHSLQ